MTVQVTLTGDMEKMHMQVLSSDIYMFILVSDKITKKRVALIRFEGESFTETSTP
jgi:hypothetical protein